MFLMLTKYPYYSFSCLTPYIYVFFRNKENKTKYKKFGQKLKKLCNEEVMVATIAFMVMNIAIYGHNHRSNTKKTLQQSFGVVATTEQDL